MDTQPSISFEFDERAGIQLVQGIGLCRSFGRHAHRSLSLGLVQCGSRRLVLPDGPVTVTAGDLFLIPAGCAHAVETLEPETYIVLSLTFELLAGDLDFKPGCLQDAYLAAMLMELGRVDASARLTLLANLLDRLRVYGRPRNGASLLPASLSKLLGLMQVEFDAELGLDELSALTGQSPWHLQRLCVAATGLSPHDHLELIRIREACRLLRSGEPPAAVAGLTGFCDQSHFSRCFRKRTGTTPGRYAADCR